MVREFRQRRPREVVRHTETRAETVPPAILARMEALEKRAIAMEKVVQVVLQVAEDLRSKDSEQDRLLGLIVNAPGVVFEKKAG